VLPEGTVTVLCKRLHFSPSSSVMLLKGMFSSFSFFFCLFFVLILAGEWVFENNADFLKCDSYGD